MTVDDNNIIWLDLFSFLSYSKKAKLINLFRGKNIREEIVKSQEVKEILSDNDLNQMCLLTSDVYFSRQVEKFKSDGIEMITINDPRYPYLLKQIYDPPFCLYCKGNVDLLNSYCVGVVGSRKITEYGTIVTKEYVKAMCENNITIVSGLAAGVDSVAHKTALESGGNTIAVLAGGLYHIYPSFNSNLAKTITENNLILSENSPDTRPLAYFFPIRNRIIAGLSKAVLLTEAGKKSGALHTKNYAIDNNREVFAVPGRINSPMSEGTNAIIKELQGAITLSPADMLESLGFKKANKKEQNVQVDLTDQPILDFIKSEKKTFQQIADHLNMPANELNIKLMELEMEGLIEKLPNNSYISANL